MSRYDPPADVLAGRNILITGAGDGIGRAAALACAAHGATVVLLGRTRRKLERVYDEIEARGGATPAMLEVDLARARPDDYATVAHTLELELGRLDGLLHNAAELGVLAPIEHYRPDTWNRVLAVNLTAAYLLTRACLPLLKRSPDASVVFTTADVGRHGRAYWGAYGTACAALEGFARILADELAANTQVRVNTLDPGPVRTAFRARAYPGEDATRHPPPEAIMPVYLYLLGPASRGQTGRQFTAERDLHEPGAPRADP
jgi:NAD(P)-dependent dehydrogenase (short-subunit alcohol dehydrogenase family)